MRARNEPISVTPLPSGWVVEHIQWGYYDGPTSGLLRTNDDRIFLSKLVATSAELDNRLFALHELKTELRALALTAFDHQRTEQHEQAGMALEQVWRGAEPIIAQEFGADLMVLARRFVDFQLVTLQQPPDVD